MKYFSVILALLGAAKAFGALPPSFEVCKRDDPNISECIVRAIDIVRPNLANGDLGDGFLVPQMEPFALGNITFGEDRGLKIFLSNVLVHGSSKFNVTKLRANIKDMKFDVLVELPMLKIFGKYKMNFNFFGAQTTSEGDYHSQLMGSKIKGTFQAHRYQSNETEYVKFEPFIIKFNRGTVTKLEISNLFGGNKLLADIVHSLILENQEFMLKNAYPQMEAKLSKLFTEISNKIIENATYDEMFPL